MSFYTIHGQMNILTLFFNDHYRFLKPGSYILAVPFNVCFNGIKETCKQNESGSLMNESVLMVKWCHRVKEAFSLYQNSVHLNL